jgi:hypothetical protein
MLSGGLTHGLNPTNPRRGKPEMRRCPGFCPYYQLDFHAYGKKLKSESSALSN